MLRTSFAAAALLGALALAAPAAAAPAEQAALDAAAFNDAAGDSGAAPDITNVAVGNDVVAGPIVFWVAHGNRPDDLVGDDVVFLLVDADRNPATGDQDGVEYVIGVDAENVWIDRWDGQAYVESPDSTLTASYFRGDVEPQLRISIHPDELGGTRDFAFYVLSSAGEDLDVAPKGPPAWAYTLATGTLQLAALEVVRNPKAPAAGKRFAAAIIVVRRDTLDFLAEGKVRCTLIVGGKAVKAARAGFTQGVPQCRWNLPRSAKGKLLRGTIFVTYGGSTAKKSFSARVK